RAHTLGFETHREVAGREAGVDEDVPLAEADEGRVPRRAAPQRDDPDHHSTPVWPNPAPPRPLAGSSSAGTTPTPGRRCTTRWSVRAPRSIRTGTSPWLTSITPISPR